MTVGTDNRSELMSLAELLTIRSSAEVYFKGQPILKGSDYVAKDLFTVIRNFIYRECYVNGSGSAEPLAEPSTTDSADPEFGRRLRSANRSARHLDPGWEVFNTSVNRIFIRKGDRHRKVEPGAVFPRNVNAQLGIGSNVSIGVAGDSFQVQNDFYYLFSEIPTDLYDDALLTRIYFNCTAAGAVRLVRGISDRFNRYEVPFFFKCLVRSRDYIRTDSAVLYLSRRYYEPAARLVAEILPDVEAELRGPVPLFTKKMARGVGAADDPGHGQSFGLHRCGLLTQGFLDAWSRNHQSVHKRLECAAHRFVSVGLDLNRPHLGRDMVDIFVLPEIRNLTGVTD